MNATAEMQTKPAPKPPLAPASSNLLQRKCACGGTPGPSGECADCRRKRLSLQRRAIRQEEPSSVPPIVHEVLRSPGQPLDPTTRASMEPRFAHDFSRVQVHTDARAAESARAVNALAYTVGRDIVFGHGQYAPGTSAGRSLMAHELTHVAQQRSKGESAGTLVIGSTDANEEREARSAETLVNTRGNYDGPSLPNEPQVLRRQPPKPGGAPSGGPAPSSAPAASCLKDATGQNINLAPGTVTVIEYGAEWCQPCKELKKELDPLCQAYQAVPATVPVNFFTVDIDLPNAANTKPPVPAGGVPNTFIFSGSSQTDQFLGSKPRKDIDVLINKAITAAPSAKTPTPTTPTPTPTTPTPTPTAPTPTPTAQGCSFTIVGIDGNDALEDKRKYTDAEIAKGRAENPTATSDAQIPTITNICQRQTFQLVTNQQNARIIHVAWKKAPPPGTLSVPRAAIDDGRDEPTGKRPSVSTMNPLINKLPQDCVFPKTLTDKPAWCVPFCSFGEYQMEVSVAYECGPEKKINTVQFGPKKITLKEKTP